MRLTSVQIDIEEDRSIVIQFFGVNQPVNFDRVCPASLADRQRRYIRIISARRATKLQKRIYEQGT
jgi:uncharacterized DUF497 family protein